MLASALVALALAGLTSGALAGYEWGGVTGYQSPYLFELSPGEPTPPLTERVLLVIVDGLRADTAAELPTYRSVGASGVRTTARTTQPSLSLPGWTLITSGAPPMISGITSNFYEDPVRVDSLFAEARRSGVSAAVAGHAIWEQLYGNELAAGSFEGLDDVRSDGNVRDGALRLLEEVDPGLLVLHLPDTDNAGHLFGVGDEYRRNADEADAIVAEVLEAAGPGTTVVYTTDHGHVGQGGHGGPEPEVVTAPLAMAGPGIAPGATLGSVEHADVAPTVAAFLGLPRPTHATGEVLLSALAVDGPTRASIEEAHAEVRARFDAAAARATGGRGGSFAEASAARQRRDVLIRLPLAIVVLGALAFAVRRGTRGLDARAVAAGVAAFLAVWAATFFGQGLTFSLSHFNTEDQIVPFLLRRLLEAVAAGLVGGGVAGLVAGRRGDARPYRVGVATAAWGMVVSAIPVAVFVAVYGWGFTWRLPDLTTAFAQYLLLLGMLGLGVTAGLVGLTAAAAARLRRPAPEGDGPSG